jgi:hypothetical protein
MSQRAAATPALPDNHGQRPALAADSPGRRPRAGLLQPFVAAERNGRWGNAIQVPGLPALNKGTSQPFSATSYDPVLS